MRDVTEQPNVAHLDSLIRLEPNDAILVVDVPDQKYLRFQEFRKYHDLIGYQVVEDEHKAQILVFQILILFEGVRIRYWTAPRIQRKALGQNAHREAVPHLNGEGWT